MPPGPGRLQDGEDEEEESKTGLCWGCQGVYFVVWQVRNLEGINELGKKGNLEEGRF